MKTKRQKVSDSSSECASEESSIVSDIGDATIEVLLAERDARRSGGRDCDARAAILEQLVVDTAMPQIELQPSIGWSASRRFAAFRASLLPRCHCDFGSPKYFE